MWHSKSVVGVIGLGVVFDGLETRLKIPDGWQSEAVRALRGGRDVIVDAPTGAGKTWVFETFASGAAGRIRGQMVYTVPTRALANDKYLTWRSAGWDVGLATGDVAHRTDAPVVVATLETQRERVLGGDGPRLLVVDEYQMLADARRGVNYETVLAFAPPSTRLLLLSGSVGNPELVAGWLGRIGRDVVRISERTRPVPLEEVSADGLPAAPGCVRGLWPRVVAGALLADMGPLLIFAPRRAMAEKLARAVAEALPCPDPLELSAEAARALGRPLAALVRRRVAYHHSGLDFPVRTAVIEPLAKHGQLRVIVATMGLAAGINFSVRSVLVSETSYQDGPYRKELRPDELLQMIGRAGRRGLDETGYLISLRRGVRLHDAAPMRLRPSRRLDWPRMLRGMEAAASAGECPVERAGRLAGRLFSAEPWDLAGGGVSGGRGGGDGGGPLRIEACDSRGDWQDVRRFERTRALLGDCRVWRGGLLVEARSDPELIKPLGRGCLCKLRKGGKGGAPVYGKQVAVARVEGEGFRPLPWVRRALGMGKGGAPVGEDALRAMLAPLLARDAEARIQDFARRGDILHARCDFSGWEVAAHRDRHGVAIIEPPRRHATPSVDTDLRARSGDRIVCAPGSPLFDWRRLGLIGVDGAPTGRGRVVARFPGGEGLLIAAALEDEHYPVDDLVLDLANIRAGARFHELPSDGSERLAVAARAIYGTVDIDGYLDRGVVPGYGEGAAFCLRNGPRGELGGDITPGDYQRMRVEWQSLLRQIVHAPDPRVDRWDELVAAASARMDGDGRGLEAMIRLIDPTLSSRPVCHRLGRGDFAAARGGSGVRAGGGR